MKIVRKTAAQLNGFGKTKVGKTTGSPVRKR